MPSPAFRPALYQRSVSDGVGDEVSCLLCPHACVIAPGHSGRCRVRANRGGTLVAAAYGVVSSLALDPVEKKPLANFFPGRNILSLGSYGCNLFCAFCQNYEISQRGVPMPHGTDDSPAVETLAVDALVGRALALVDRGNVGVAYTYNEPFVNFEYLLDACRAVRTAGLKNVLVTNGYVNPEPLSEIMPFVDAVNVDLKAFGEDFYRKVCGGSLEPVKRTIEAIARDAPDCDLEVTTLVIPGRNSSPTEIDGISRFLASVSKDITLHLSRHHPAYRMAEPGPIGVDELLSLADIARRNLASVRCGNIG